MQHGSLRLCTRLSLPPSQTNQTSQTHTHTDSCGPVSVHCSEASGYISHRQWPLTHIRTLLLSSQPYHMIVFMKLVQKTVVYKHIDSNGIITPSVHVTSHRYYKTLT